MFGSGRLPWPDEEPAGQPEPAKEMPATCTPEGFSAAAARTERRGTIWRTRIMSAVLEVTLGNDG